MKKQTVFLTGATGTMGFLGLQELLKDLDRQNIVLLVLDTEQDRQKLKKFGGIDGLTIHWGDLKDYNAVYECVKCADIILHVAALVSPAADYQPRLAMEVNYGSTRNIIRAIREQKRMDEVKLVYIGTVAETGDRMPPIHWGRVGDPIKPSMFDYYAVSKVAAERLVIESGLKYWVSLRQTGIVGPAMCRITDAIIFHNCLDNVLEYVSDRDSGALLGNLCRGENTGELSEDFWGHIYNIGGGESCRVDTYTMFKQLYGAIGIENLNHAMEAKWFATRNFHGQYYLDSDKLEEHLHFRHDSMQYLYDAYLEFLGLKATASKLICRLPGGQKFMGSNIKKVFLREVRGEHGTVRFVERNMEKHICAYWGCKEKWAEIPDDVYALEHFTDWDTAIVLDHGYDENKPESELLLQDMKDAAAFRGGECISADMIKGDWSSKIRFRCAFGHEFEASPRLVLEGGHWCPDCERNSWNYAARAKVDRFFAQVWNPLHDLDEEEHEYIKEVTELEI